MRSWIYGLALLAPMAWPLLLATSAYAQIDPDALYRNSIGNNSFGSASPYSYENSPLNWNNSALNYRNSPLNWNNSPLNRNSNSIYNEDGERTGYAVRRPDGGVNFFDEDGNRTGYLPGRRDW